MLKKYKKVKMVKNFKMLLDFQTPKFLELALLSNRYKISKNEENQNCSKLPVFYRNWLEQSRFLDQICPKSVFEVYNRTNEHHHRIQHV